MSRYENYAIKNNVFGTLSAPISSLATTIQLNSGQGARFSVNQLATLENVEDGKVKKREIVKITAIAGDVLTVVRKYAPCPANDDANTQGQVSYAFSADDTINVYITKEHFDNIKDSLDDLYNNGNDRLYIKQNGGLSITVTGGVAKVGNDYVICSGGDLTLTNNANNYLMINSAGNIVVNTVDRIEENCRLAKIITASGEITSITKWKVDTVGGVATSKVKEEKYVTIENVQKGDILTLQTYDDGTSKATSIKLGETNSGFTKLGIKIYGSGIVGDTVKTYLIKNGSGQVLTARIETDSSGEPSGTLASANATGTVQTTDISSSVDTLTEIEFNGSFALTTGTVYWLVLSVPTLNASNYLTLYGNDNGDVQAYDGVDWGAPTEQGAFTELLTNTSRGSQQDPNYGTYFEFTVVMAKTIHLTNLHMSQTTEQYGVTFTRTIKEGDTVLYTTTGNDFFDNATPGYNPDLYLLRGHTYTFTCSASGGNLYYLYQAQNPNNTIFSSVSGTFCGTGGDKNQCTAFGYYIFDEISMKTNVIGDVILPNYLKKITAVDFDNVYDTIGIAMGNANAGNYVPIAVSGLYEDDNLDLVPGQNYAFDGTNIIKATNTANRIYLGNALSTHSINIDIKAYLSGNGICHINGRKRGGVSPTIVVKGDSVNGYVLKGF